MGFDNECIVNIQSLAGEYFCPVCRLLVFPNEALQSQCTHLYCKPCLTYVVSTTRACPYDGYLVTEADSKPLIESNKALAETIGKIPVHCLYHRSGCSWQGTFTECTSHCSGCAFGNSPVVCNRCGVQIVHRQVQEHAQTCPGVQQVAATQDPSATSASAVAPTDQNQTAAPVGLIASQPLTSQAVVATTTPGHVLNQLPNPASQTQALAQTAAQPTAEQWYQQQQQYQQYYQQYPGQDPYQQQYQQYYPYQQSAVPQYQQAYGQPQPQAQTQAQPQPQVQHQSQPQPQPQPEAQGLSQPLSHAQAPVVPQSQNQMQVHQQPNQVQPAVQPHGQAFPQTQPYPYPQAQSHSGQPQPQQHMQVPPYQQPHSQMHHSQPQIQQPAQKYPAPQPQLHPQMQPNASVQHLSQPPMHPHQSMAPSNVQPQVQNPSSHAVTGHHSYPQPPAHQNMQLGAPQHTMHMHPQSGPQLQAQPSAQLQNQFPQQTPMMRPNQSSHAMFPNQQPAVLPSPVQSQSTPPLQQQPVYTRNQQTGQTNQRPILQQTQQILPQQPFAQHQMPMPSHLRPQGAAHLFPKHAYPQPQGNTALSQWPSNPNHAGHQQPYAQSGNTIPVRPGNQNLSVGTNNQVQLSTELQSRAPESIEKQGDVIVKPTDSASGKLGNELKSEKETDLKSTGVGSNHSEDPHSVRTSENGDSVNKSGGTLPGAQHASNEHSAVLGNEIQDGPPPKTETKLSESETDKQHNDDTCTPKPPPGGDNPAPAVSQTNGGHGPGIDEEYKGMQSGGLAQPSHPASFTNQGKHQQPINNYTTAAFQQRPSSMLAPQLPHSAVPNQPLSAGNSAALIRNHGPSPTVQSGQPLNSVDNFQPNMAKHPHGSDIQFNNPGRSFKLQPLGPPGPYNQVHEPPFHTGAPNLSHSGGPQFGAPPAPEGFGMQDERFKSFQVSHQQNLGRREFEDDLQKFPRPLLDAEPVSNYGNYSFGPHETGKRPVGFYDDAIKKPGSTLHPGYLGLGPGYGRNRMDGMATRSPAGEYPEMPPRRGGLVSKPGMDDFDGRAASRFGESVGIAFRDNRFPHPASHLHRDEFDGFGNFRMGEHPGSGDFIGRDEFAGRYQRGEHLGPHNFPRHLQLEERIAFGAHSGHMRAVELGGSRSFESFSKGNRPGHPQLGEPGFRSSFSLQGFPNDAGILSGDARSFDNLRRRKAASMGWCRICKVDCETVEGLELHSQTREHQKMAMDMVKTIKQNAKKHKFEQSSLEDGNRTRSTGFDGHGNKH